MRNYLIIFLGLFLTLTAFYNVEAQSATASLSGTVVDANGAVVSGAIVKIANKATGFISDFGKVKVLRASLTISPLVLIKI